jgi:hypothetical protein
MVAEPVQRAALAGDVGVMLGKGKPLIVIFCEVADGELPQVL